MQRNVLAWCLGCFLALVVPGVALGDGSGMEPLETEQATVEDAGAQEIVVTATRLESPTVEVASSVTVINREQIERSQKQYVADLLRDVPGLDVAGNGGPGQPTSVFIRGAKSEHTLVLIDGIEANDPFTPGRSFNFANLTTDNIERVEVIRGPQSVLYGSDAIGGVINIITRTGSGKPSFFFSTEAGSFDTYKEALGVSGGTSLLNYSLALSRLDTRGISAASSARGNRERDGYENTSVSARLGLTPSEILELDLIVRCTDAEGDLDNFGGPLGDDPNYVFEDRQLFTRLQGTLVLCDGLWEQTLGVSFTDFDRRFRNDTDFAHPLDLSRSRYRGQIVKFDWQHNLYLHETNTLVFGLETEEESGRSEFFSDGMFGPYVSIIPEKSARTNSVYVQDVIELWDSFFMAVGARLDDHDEFGSEVTYRIAPAYLFRKTGTKIKATYGTGFKAPTLYQLYSDFGDVNLEPEKSKGWDAGIEQYLCDDRVTVGATYFENEFEDLIDFGPMFTYVNVAEAESKGVEVFGTYRPTDDLSFRVSYTHQSTEDKATGEDLLRRPRNKAGLDVNYRFLDKKANVNLNVTHVTTRQDLDFSTFPSTRVDLDRYTLLNLAGSYDVNERLQIFARVENLLDEEYEEVRGFGTPGVGVFGGVKIRF